MFRGLSRAFSQLRKGCLVTPPVRSIFNLRNIFGTLKNEFDHSREAGSGRHNTHTMEATETELFDEDAHEVTAMVTDNPFDLEIFMGDNNPQKNFGTVDNPVLLFSANVGWRYVMCTGQNDEDEGLSHTGVWFILREGPIHRCGSCGQCFKLVNLKDEISEENDYYISHFMPILEEEMGDDDDLVTRWTFHNFAEEYPSIMPMQSTLDAFILVNADDHDRILTDPAYRIQKLYQGHQTLNHFHQAMYELELKCLWNRGGRPPPVKYTKAEYEDLITSELAIKKLDRMFEKILRYQKRAIMEPDEHERREARMRERAEERGKNLTVYLNTNENELRFRDYFESDQDSETELLAEQEDEHNLIMEGIFNFQNYIFVEEGTDGTVPVVGSIFENKIFKFKHRKWNEDPASHFIRENRMINRFLDRLKTRDPELDISSAEIDKVGVLSPVHKKFLHYAAEEAVLQYKDYYESDEEDIRDFENITPEEKAQFAVVFKDYAKPLGEIKSVHTVKQRDYDKSKSVIENLKDHYKDLKTRVLPEIKNHSRQHALEEVGLTDSRTVDQGPFTVEYKYVDGLHELFGEKIKKVIENAETPRKSLKKQ